MKGIKLYFVCAQKQEVRVMPVAQRSRGSNNFQMWRSPITRKRRNKKRSLPPMKICYPPVRRIPTHHRGGTPAPVGTHNGVLLTQSLVPALIWNPPLEECGPAGEHRHQAAGEYCSPSETGRCLQEPSLPAVKAALPATASPPVWIFPRRSAAFPQGVSSPLPCDTSHPPLRGGHPPSDPCLLFVPFPQVATNHLKFLPFPR